MTDITGGDEQDPPGPIHMVNPPQQDKTLPVVPETQRESLRRALIPRKYRGFIPLAVILFMMAVLYLGLILFPGGSGVAEPSPEPVLPETATPSSPPATGTQPTPAGTQVTATPAVSGTPDFTLTTSPVSASAGPGETVTYTMVIDGKNGFDSPVRLELTATALFVTRRYDFGTYNPPFPQTIHYPFVVPDYLPPGVTVDGVLKATSGDLVRENRLILVVE
ncbi:MAG: hypothetical protein LUO91_06455 [Methanomicrobiales archaeon]|nr:hypothetical protein [Methanomicrobiales archaeon]